MMNIKVLSIFLSFIAVPLQAQTLCGNPPEFSVKSEESESIKGDLQGKAQFLSRFVGDAELSGEIDSARRIIYQSADTIAAAQQDAYLAYMFCTIIINDTSMTSKEKIKSIQEFRRPLSDLLPFQKSSLWIASWAVGGWLVTVANPSKFTLLVDKALLIATPKSNGNKLVIDVKIFVGPNQGRPIQVQPNNTDNVSLRAFACAPSFVGTWSLLEKLRFSANSWFNSASCQLCLNVHSISGESAQVCDGFDCSQIPVPDRKQVCRL